MREEQSYSTVGLAKNGVTHPFYGSPLVKQRDLGRKRSCAAPSLAPHTCVTHIPLRKEALTHQPMSDLRNGVSSLKHRANAFPTPLGLSHEISRSTMTKPGVVPEARSYRKADSCEIRPCYW